MNTLDKTINQWKTFKVLTNTSIKYIDSDIDHENFIDDMICEQYNILLKLGYELENIKYTILLDTKVFQDMTIYDAISSLASDEGADLVRFNNGNIGFVGYCGSLNLHDNCFEIIKNK